MPTSAAGARSPGRSTTGGRGCPFGEGAQPGEFSVILGGGGWNAAAIRGGRWSPRRPLSGRRPSRQVSGSGTSALCDSARTRPSHPALPEGIISAGRSVPPSVVTTLPRKETQGKETTAKEDEREPDEEGHAGHRDGSEGAHELDGLYATLRTRRSGRRLTPSGRLQNPGNGPESDPGPSNAPPPPGAPAPRPPSLQPAAIPIIILIATRSREPDGTTAHEIRQA